MRVFSALAGIGFTAADSITDLVAAVQQHHGRSDILIDTPGFGAAETGSAADLAQALDSFPGRDVHLVLPASMRRRDLELCAERFAGFKPHRVLITRLDETESAGAILSTALKIKTPLSFVCSGQSVPEDLEIAGIAKLTGTFLPAATQKTATAA